MVRRSIRALGLALALCAYAGASLERAAASGDVEGWGYELWNELMSPFCPGRTLASCTSTEADDLRMWILVQEASGRSRDDVEAQLYAQFGDVLRAAPRARGWHVLAYVIPLATFLGGGVFVVLFLRRQVSDARAAAPAEPRPPPRADPELERIVDEELAR